MFDIVLGYTYDPNDHVDKTFESSYVFTGTLRDGSSIIDPVVLIDQGAVVGLINANNYNYAYISVFHRYYYVRNIEWVNQGLVAVSMHVDVLMSYKDAIRNHTAIIDKQEQRYNLFLDDQSIKTYQNPWVFTRTFPNHFPDPLFVLVTSGSPGTSPEPGS